MFTAAAVLKKKENFFISTSFSMNIYSARRDTTFFMKLDDSPGSCERNVAHWLGTREKFAGGFWVRNITITDSTDMIARIQ